MILTRLTRPILIKVASKVMPGSEGLEKLTKDELFRVIKASRASNEELKDLVTKLDVAEEDLEPVLEEIIEEDVEEYNEELVYLETQKVEPDKKLSLPLAKGVLKPKVVKKVINRDLEVIVPDEFEVLLRLKRNGTIYEKGSILRERINPQLTILLKDGVIKPNVCKVK